MFHSARIKLTIWYVAIIMFVSIFFSLVIYAGINTELKRLEYFQQIRIERQQEGFPVPVIPRRSPSYDLLEIVEARNRLSGILVLINFGILVLSAATAYFLSGRTLAPIAEMVREQNRFITDASHELRTPLTSLRSEIEVNLRDKHISRESALQLLRSNLEEVVGLQSLSDHLMELTSLQKKNGGILLEKISLTDVITSAYNKVIPLARNKQITIQNKITDLHINGYRQSLIELFVILLDNAIKYSNKKKKITIFSEIVNYSVLVHIIDQGIGIADKDLPFIFDRFYRADKSRSKENATGYGLGLSIAKEIVILHGGKITVESKINKGTEFVIHIPGKSLS